MNSKPVILHMCALLLGALLVACAASDEASQEQKDGSAQVEQAAADTVRTSDTLSVPVGQQPPSSAAAPAQATRQGFTTKEDTIEVESEQRSRRQPEPGMAVNVQPHAATLPADRLHQGDFSVQIGAFRKESNAERAKARFEKRYRARIATKSFDEARQLYRVTIDEFPTQKEAWRFASSLRKHYPQEYSQAWVVVRHRP